MKIFLRVICYVSFLSAIFFTSSFEAPLHRIQQDTGTNNGIDTEQQQVERSASSSIPPFLHNFYKQLSAIEQHYETDPSLTVYKGYFNGAATDVLHNLIIPPLYSDAFFNFTFERAEMRIWYRCNDISNRETFYIELSSDQFQFKHRTRVNCQMSDENNEPTPDGWSVFDVTELMLALQTTQETALRHPLTFSVTTSSHLLSISKQVLSSKDSPSHLPLLALYNSHVIRHVEPRDVSMRYTPFNLEDEDEGEGIGRSVRAVGISSCSRISKSMRVSDFLRLMRAPSFTFVFPTTFNFGYCHGYCPFRLINHHNGTTHAQIMNTIAQLHHKPRYAKCVPASYKNLYILFTGSVDDVEVTSIRGYRDAIVGNCGCR